MPPEPFDLRVIPQGKPQYRGEAALRLLCPPCDPQKPTGLSIGCYQPFHGDHQRLLEKGLCRVGQVYIAGRDTHGIDAKSPLPFFAVKQRIEAAPSAHAGRFMIVSLPNLTNLLAGSEVGYSIGHLVLDNETVISVTKMRKRSAVP